MTDRNTFKINWNSAEHSPATLLDHAVVELSEDWELTQAGAVVIRKPLRIALAETTGTLVLEVKPLSPKRNAVELWTSEEDLLIDHFQPIDQRYQNYEPHLRRMPGQYRLSAWEPEEWDAISPTKIERFYLPPEEWATLVVTWSKPDNEPGNTFACLNGMPVAVMAGILAWLRLTHEDCEFQQSFAGAMYWQRAVLLCGVQMKRCLFFEEGLSTEDAVRISREASDAEWFRHSATSLCKNENEPAPDDALERKTPLWREALRAHEIRLDALDCEPLQSSMPLDVRNADPFNYWHYEATDCTNKTGLAGLLDDEPLHYWFDVSERGSYWLVLRYQLVVPPVDTEPALSVEVDAICPGESFKEFKLPSTTISGSMRPEPNRYKEIRIGESTIELDPGRHELSITFHDNGHLVLDSILLTMEKVQPNPSQAELIRYTRPPALEVVSIIENEGKTVYGLRFHNLQQGPQSGTLMFDDASDPGEPASLTVSHLKFDSEDDFADTDLSVPVDSANKNVRRVRIIFEDDAQFNRMSYVVRHRRPFAIAQRPIKIVTPNLLYQPLERPADEEALARRIEEIQNDPFIRTWLEKTPEEIENEPMLIPGGHSTPQVTLMIELAHFGGDKDTLQRLRAVLLANARATLRLNFIGPDGERRAGLRVDYYNFRTPRAGLYGEMALWEIVAYDLLLAEGMLSLEDQIAIEPQLFWSTFENSKRWMGGELICRGQIQSSTAGMQLGAVLDDEPMLQDVEETILRYGQWQILADGGHNEKISSYGGGWTVLVDCALFLRGIGRPRIFDLCRERIREASKSFIRGSFSNGSILRQGNGGIQRSFHVLSTERYLKIACELFPDDPDFPAMLEYSIALGERLNAKWAHQPPEEWPEFPDRLLRKSDLFPDSGWCVLRSQPSPDRLEASLDWSAFGDHGQPEKLHVNVLALDEVMNQGMGYGWTPQLPKSQRYAMRTVSHSTVVSNMRCQLAGSKGNLILFDHHDDMQVAWADAGRCYEGGVRADRCIVLVGETLIDFFHIAGGRRRSFDWLFHCQGEPELPDGFAPRGPLADHGTKYEKVSDAPGYEFLEKLQELSPDGPMQFDFHLTGYPQMGWGGAPKRWLDYELGRLWLTFPQTDDTTYVVGEAPFPMPDEDSYRPFVMARRWARATCFAAVFRSRTDNQTPAPVRSLPVTLRGVELASHQAVAVEVTDRAGQTTTVLQRHVAGPLSAGQVTETDAKLVVYTRTESGSHVALHAYDATYVVLADGTEHRQPTAGEMHL